MVQYVSFGNGSPDLLNFGIKNSFRRKTFSLLFLKNQKLDKIIEQRSVRNLKHHVKHIFMVIMTNRFNASRNRNKKSKCWKMWISFYAMSNKCWSKRVQQTTKGGREMDSEMECRERMCRWFHVVGDFMLSGNNSLKERLKQLFSSQSLILNLFYRSSWKTVISICRFTIGHNE